MWAVSSKLRCVCMYTRHFFCFFMRFGDIYVRAKEKQGGYAHGICGMACSEMTRIVALSSFAILHAHSLGSMQRLGRDKSPAPYASFFLRDERHSGSQLDASEPCSWNIAIPIVRRPLLPPYLSASTRNITLEMSCRTQNARKPRLKKRAS